jgi:twitching motility protein PilT
MLAQKLLPLLARQDVTELLLHSGRPPVAMSNGAAKRVSATTLQDDDIIGVLAALGGGRYLSGLADGVTWTFQADGVGIVEVRAGHDGMSINACLRRALVQTPAPAPATAVSPRTAAAAQLAPTMIAQRAPVAVLPSARGQVAARVAAPVAARHALSENVDAFPTAEPSSAAMPVPSAPPRIDPDPHEAPAAQPHVITSHDGFNFETWGSNAPPPIPDAPAVRAKEAPVPKFVGDAIDELLAQARAKRASDAHILSDRAATLRIAGELVPIAEPLSDEIVRELLLKRIPEVMRASFQEHGSCDFSLVHPRLGRFRVNVTRQRSGMKLTARPIAVQVPTLQELGLPDSIGRALHHHQGLIVITGPTGSGKTTTLSALVGMINRDTTHHVITVEDPVEFIHETAKAVISQREVGTHTKSFQNALKASLREDPDVIVVGELRDFETVRMALSASETGHLVIATMNAPSASKAIERLIDLFPPGDQPQVRMTLAGGLRLIISQRLLPTSDRKSMCAAAEVLPGVPQLWALIRDDRTFQIPSLQQRGKALGIVRLDESLATLIKGGRTTFEIAKEYAESADLLESLVTGKPMKNAPVDADAKPAKPAGTKTLGGAQAPAIAAGATLGAGKEVGKQLLSRAGKLFNRDEK